MIIDYKYNDIEKYLKKDSEVGNDILDAFESLTDAAIIFSPIIFGAHLLPLLELLEVKNKLFELGHKVYNCIIKRIEMDYIDRIDQIKAAYALICYTAYFDVLEDAIPKKIRKKLKLKLEQKRELFDKSTESSENLQTSPTTNIHCNIFYADHVTSFSDIKEQLLLVYKRITDGLNKLIVEASIFDEDNVEDKRVFEELKVLLNALPEKAINVYEAQYLTLADSFSDFAMFAQLKNFEGIQHSIKGSVFSSYLETIRTFQQNQKLMKRPVRVIVTSRITLIDKARIPVNSTILRLMEFNQQQRQAWIDIWNSTNADYFTYSGINPFKLPPKEKGSKNSIIELAEQPLLLLMLALYDSEENELAQMSNIKRTELYDNLLRRFIRRERSRYVPGFADKTPKEQEVIIDQEMNRLGVIAIGMYNRRDVVIRSDQLEKDLEAFQARRDDRYSGTHTLTEAESVLGGFFFIHKSTAQDVNANSENVTNAYEFLHNTFGEFLAADFILRNTITEVKNIYIDRTYKSSNITGGDSNPAPDFKPSWFYCLMFVALYSRPVIVEMLREHALKAFNSFLQIYEQRIAMTNEDFINNLKYIVQSQLKMILNTRSYPQVMSNGILFDNDIPLLGYLSTYTLNLIILITTISPNGFQFEEDEYRQQNFNELDLKPWDKLASLWKAWFSPADLVGLSVILKAKRKNDKTVFVECNKKFEATRYEQPVDVMLCISATLADTLIMSLSGLQTTRFCEITRMNNGSIRKILEGESFDLYITYLLTLLRREINGFSTETNDIDIFKINYQNINYLIETIFLDSRIHSVNYDILLMLFETLEICLLRKIVFFSTRKKLVKVLPRLIDSPRISIRKKAKSFIPINAVRVLQLLVPNRDYPLFEKRFAYDEPFYRNMFNEEEWTEDLERMLRHTFRYTQNEIFHLQTNEMDKSYQMSLLDAVESSTTMRLDDKIRILQQFICYDNLEDLIKTNPELPLRAILILTDNNVNIEQVVEPSTVYRLLDFCCYQLSSVGISYFGFNAVISAITVARRINADKYLDEITGLLHYKLFRRYKESFAQIIYLHPDFVVKLIDVLPKLFYDIPIDVFETVFFRKGIRYTDNKKIFEYIKIFRCLYEMKNRKSNLKKLLSKGLDGIINVFLELNDSNRLEINQLTITQIDDLIWCSEYIGDPYVVKKIEEFLHKYSRIIHYNNLGN